jgi:membrane associated rhomboid family serine protease
MLIPIGFEARTERRGYVTYALAAVCSLIFAYQLTDGGREATAPYLARYNVERLRERAGKELRREIQNHPLLGKQPPEQIDRAVEALLDEHVGRPEQEWTRRPWVLVTCTFLHADFWHLLGNMVFLVVFGRAVNGRMGHGTFLGVYLGAGAVSSLAHIIFSGSAGGALLGASGAISGVMGLALAFFPRHQVRLFVWLWRFVRVIEVRAFWAILYWFGYDLLMVFVVGKGGGVAVMAHVAGYAAGLLAGVGLLAGGLLKKDGWDLVSTLGPRRGAGPAAAA